MAQEFTREEVAKHCKADDCWLIVSNRVYNVTDFLGEHPAGQSIMMVHAGKDCTEAFLDVHREDYFAAFAPRAFVGVVAGSGASAPAPRPPGSGRVDFSSRNVLLLKRSVFGEEHEAFRAQVRAFLTAHVVPQYSRFEARGVVDEAIYTKMAEAGFYLRFSLPKEDGGLGLTDWRYNAIVCEEVEDLGCGGFFANLGNDMVLSYFTKSCTKEQYAHWLPTLRRGASIAVAMSEPEVGSDLGRLACVARRTADGYVLNGRKMWISSGSTAQLFVIACVTDPTKGAKGISLIVVERGTEGFAVAKRFGKLGKIASDTCLITLRDVKVPQRNLIGEEGKGFIYMMSHLPKERLSIAVGSVAAARRALALATNYANGRAAFGGVIGSLQSTQMKLARIRAEVQSCTCFVDRCIADASSDELSAEGASAAKFMATELAFRVADECLQVFGGYGYLKNSPIGKMMVDQRVTRIYGGASEVLLEILAKGLGFKPQRPVSKL